MGKISFCISLFPFDDDDQVVPELTVWKKETQKFALKKLVDVGLLDYAPCYEERGYIKAKDREMVKM